VARAPKPRPRESNFGGLVIKQHLDEIKVTGHALVRCVQRLQPGIPDADQIAREAASLEEKGRYLTDTQQRRLGQLHARLHEHVEPHVRLLIALEGFWATMRPGWCRSRTHADGHLQVGALCYFPVTVRDGWAILMTCEVARDRARRDITWDIALARSYTLVPKPYISRAPMLLAPPSLGTVARLAWSARHEHEGLLRAFRATRTAANSDTRHENERRKAVVQEAYGQWLARCEVAARSFRARHESV
jgi:hypothetical protein